MSNEQDQFDEPVDDSARAEHREEVELQSFESAPDDQGLSLDALSETYAELIGRGDDPYHVPDEDDVEEGDGQFPNSGDESPSAESSLPDDDGVIPLPERDLATESNQDDFEITPLSILEAMLFVGHPDNSPLNSTQVASMMRGVRPDEIHELVGELNETYQKDGSPYEIAATGAGYQMRLRSKYVQLRDKFYGTVREARLSQAAIDVLAIVAYNQPLTREDVEKLRGKPSGGLLRQLVRRQLLRIERSEGKPRITRYFTTDRFLELFALDQLEDLPQSHELDSR